MKWIAVRPLVEGPALAVSGRVGHRLTALRAAATVAKPATSGKALASGLLLGTGQLELSAVVDAQDSPYAQLRAA